MCIVQKKQTLEQMHKFIQRLPEEIEYKIREYVFCDLVKCKLLLDKYPMSFNLFSGVTKNQLKRLYKYACLAKFLSWNNGYYSNIMREKVKYLFPIFCYDNKNIYNRPKYVVGHPSVYKFTKSLEPPFHFNTYWTSGGKQLEPSTLEYMQNIVHFCNHILEFPRRYQNQRLQEYCDKIVHQIIICVLFLKRKNEEKHKN
jgi:hypothetical protein